MSLTQVDCDSNQVNAFRNSRSNKTRFYAFDQTRNYGQYSFANLNRSGIDSRAKILI